ncbi:MAG TPA: rhomboid family intramembrane serine protease [Candidatus Limnocylindrales bacterium]|nr:rhomboid family intramembrane serine protease [Candidatus Limnocylindrales bacterium]
MIPLRDANPVRRTPVVTIAIIVACIAAFAYRLGVESNGGDAEVEAFFRQFGLVPAQLINALDAGRFLGEETLAVFTSMFLHADIYHIAGNMIFLWIFGNNIEDRLGRLPFLLFYLGGGVAAALAQVLIDPTSTAPMVGASGAIAAVLGAYVVLYPRARILALVFLVFFYQLIEVPAIIVLGLFFVLNLIDGLNSLGQPPAQGGVAFFAHIGGFIAGVVVGLVVRARGAGGAGRDVGERSPLGPGVG